MLLVLVYVGGALTYGTVTDWQPEGVDPATVYAPVAADATPPQTVSDSTITLTTWNVGYGGLGADADFFLDAGAFYTSGGRMVRSPEDHVERYARGIVQQVGAMEVDFVLLQEVDSLSARSYYRPEVDEIRAAKPALVGAFAPNYINRRIPVPVFEPWNAYGDVYSGLLSLSRYAPTAVERHQLPGEFPWPNRLFQLDRCLLVERFPLADGRTLTVVNVHLSAYDDGTVKAAQLGYLDDFLTAEQAAGHLVVVGGDFNMVPPNFAYDRFIGDPTGRWRQLSLPDTFPTVGWQWLYDARVPSNRKTADPYLRDSTFVTVIDMFLISPGLRAVQVRGIEQDFQFSDHQPVYVELAVEPAGSVGRTDDE